MTTSGCCASLRRAKEELMDGGGEEALSEGEEMKCVSV
jgi:hypothetical protein